MPARREVLVISAMRTGWPEGTIDLTGVVEASEELARAPDPIPPECIEAA